MQQTTFINELSNLYSRQLESVIQSLSTKYNFDAREAMSFINCKSNNKIENNFDFNEKVNLFNMNTISNDETIQKKKRGRPKKIKENDDIPTTPKKRGRPKKENKVTMVVDTDSENSENEGNDKSLSLQSLIKDNENIENTNNMDIEEKEINVENWIHKDTKYLKDDQDIVYDIDSHEIIGYWNGEIIKMIED